MEAVDREASATGEDTGREVIIVINGEEGPRLSVEDFKAWYPQMIVDGREYQISAEYAEPVPASAMSNVDVNGARALQGTALAFATICFLILMVILIYKMFVDAPHQKKSANDATPSN